MKLRPPAIPLITCDPYFSVWSASNALTDSDTVHWTDSPITVKALAEIDGKAYRFMGTGDAPAMEQTAFDMDAFSTIYTFAADGVKLTAKFTSPVKPDDLYLVSRPVSYLKLTAESTDGKAHKVSVKVSVSEEICLNKAGQYEAVTETLDVCGLSTVKMGSSVQKILNKAGDDFRIDWGYFYLSAKDAEVGSENKDGLTYAYLKKELDGEALITFAYDDIKSIQYFGENLKAYWKKSGETIKKAIDRAHRDYAATMKKCEKFSARMIREATYAGGEKYADLLVLSLRQSVAAHKLVLDGNGEVLYISKECFSNGCAATVDVSYPSIPLFLIYNPELVKGMMRPIYKFAASDKWGNDFAPHDAGRYPLVNGQVYGLIPETGELRPAKQMPVEECGNMLVMEANAAIASGDVSFAASHIDVLEQWVEYLKKYGNDPENQLCTDDFAGHLAHNCNLALKAIMGIAALGIIKNMMGEKNEADGLFAIAREMGKSWAERAANGDGSYRLAFDWQNSFSMKYNMVWDKLWGLRIMPEGIFESEFKSYAKHINKYGLPLDNRADYTKSDWYIWTGVMAKTKREFEGFIEPLWDAYNETESRVPMTDWYMTSTALHRLYLNPKYYGEKMVSFRNRTVVGGHFIKLLEYKKVLKNEVKR